MLTCGRLAALETSWYLAAMVPKTKPARASDAARPPGTLRRNLGATLSFQACIIIIVLMITITIIK